MQNNNHPKILLCEPNILLARKIEKIIFTAGGSPDTHDSVPPLSEDDPPVLSVISESLLDNYIEIFSELQIPAIIVYDNNLPRLLKMAGDTPFINHFVALDQSKTVRTWELLYILRLMLRPVKTKGIKSILRWGARIHETSIASTDELRNAVDWTSEFCSSLGTPPKVRDAFSELTHELLMNAIYDAPVNEEGIAVYAHNRKADIILEPEQAAVFSLGTDGDYIAVRVKDPFGRLKRSHIFGGMFRALEQGELNLEGGGAGLGMSYVYMHGIASFFTVNPDKYTEVMVIYDLSLNRRSFSSLSRSVHFFYNAT